MPKSLTKLGIAYASMPMKLCSMDLPAITIKDFRRAVHSFNCMRPPAPAVGLDPLHRCPCATTLGCIPCHRAGTPLAKAVVCRLGELFAEERHQYQCRWLSANHCDEPFLQSVCRHPFRTNPCPNVQTGRVLAMRLHEEASKCRCLVLHRHMP